MNLLDVGAARGADLAAQRRLFDERAQGVDERLLRRGTIGMRMPQPCCAALDHVRLEVRDDRLAERHRLEREDTVPAGVQLVDDDVARRVAVARLVVRQALDDVQVDVQLLARVDDVRGPLLLAVRRRVQTSGRSRSDGGTGVKARRSSRGDDVASAPSGSRRSEDDSASARFERELLGRLAADVGAEVVEELFFGACAGAELEDFGTSVSPK